MSNNVRHSGCALCDIKETGHGIIVYPDIRWITAINKQDGNFYMVFGHEGETAKMQIAYCPVCGKRLNAEVIDSNRTARKIEWFAPKSCPPDVDEFLQ